MFFSLSFIIKTQDDKRKRYFGWQKLSADSNGEISVRLYIGENADIAVKPYEP